MISNKSCFLCHSEKYIVREGRVRDNAELSVLECANCGLVRLSDFSHIYKGFYEKSNMHCEDGEYKSYDDWLKETYTDDHRRFKYLEQIVRDKRVLDVGCGNGGFLKILKKTAKEVMGVELEVESRERMEKSGLQVYSAIDEVREKVDIITMFHVLEHLDEPIENLMMLKKCLFDSSSQLIIEVPNANDALLTLFESKRFASFTYWSCHLYLYNIESLRRLAYRCGFKVNYIKSIQRYSLANHLHWLAKGTAGGQVIWHFLDSEELSKEYERQLASLELTDTLIASFSLL